ncbi:MAG: hypothetical protein Q9163_004866 [Psora crenata]
MKGTNIWAAHSSGNILLGRMPSLDNVESSPPPRYSEPTTHRDNKASEARNNSHGPWLVRRTSIHIESVSAVELDVMASQRTSVSPSSHDQRGSLRNLFAKGGNTQPDVPREITEALRQPFEPNQLGTKVTIEATRPIRTQADRRIELKGLQEAASAKRWAGTGRPGEAWGKLIRDPELWDPTGDTYIYFGYQRPDPSFRIKSSILEETKSEELINKLREGHCNPAKRPNSPADSTSTPSLGSLHRSSRGRLIPSGPDDDTPIRYKIHFPTPPQASRIDILRHHITTRNLLALLTYKPFVGLTYYQALVDLQERCEDLMPGTNSAQLLIRALIRNRLHNVSNDPAAAAGLLAWSEDNFWQEGWREGYVHCSGMYSLLRKMSEFRDISHVTRSLLERSNLELKVRIHEAEDRLATFEFGDIWPTRKDQQPSVPMAFNSFRRFLIHYYKKAYKSWPPRNVGRLDAWLARDLAAQLQKDFGALYKFYVDRDVVWDDTGKHMIRKTARTPMRAQNSNDLCLEKALVGFDLKHKYHHIPNPHPILPQPIQVSEAAQRSQSKPLFGRKAKALEKRVLSASTEASNAILLAPEITANSLVQAFIKFDRSDRLGEEDPCTVRKIRWVLLYGILQVLSNLAADTPHLWFKDDVNYYLNPRLKGMPPWKTGDHAFEDATWDELHRWLTPTS